MTVSRAVRRAGALSFLLMLGGALLPGPSGQVVLGHAQLVASTPGAGVVVPDAPTEIRLVFSEPLERQLTSLDIRDGGGDLVVDRGGEIDPDDPFSLVAALPALADGTYSVTWRTLSAADGHTAEGFFSFGIGDGELVPPVDAGGSDHAEGDRVDAVARTLTYVGLLGALGVAIFHRVVIRRGPMPVALRRLLAAGLGLAGIATLVAGFANGAEAGGGVEYLLGTRNGVLQLARGVAALAAAGLLLAVPGRVAGIVASGGALTGIVLLAAAGHAAAIPGPAAILSQVAHVAGAGVWLSGVAALLALLVRPGILVDGDAPPVREVVPRFSALALVSIGTVGITGVYAAWVQTGTLVDPGTDYGRTLILKTVVATAALALGGLNYLDGGRMRGWLGGIRARTGTEAVIGMAVLAITAVLATTAPTEMATGVPIRPVADAFGETTPGMTLSIVPGRPGVNRVTVGTNDAMAGGGIGMELVLDRLDAGTTTRVPLVSDAVVGHGAHGGDTHGGAMDPSSSAAPAAVDDDGRTEWSADALVLPAGSRWDTNVLLVSADGVELGRQRFSFTLDDGGISDGREASLLDVSSGVALVLLVGGALALGLALGGARLPRCEAIASRIALLGAGGVAVALGLVIGGSRLLAS